MICAARMVVSTRKPAVTQPKEFTKSSADGRNDAIDPKPTSDLHQIFAVAITGLRTSVRQNVTPSFGTSDGTDSFHFY
jgi:hypothetical protein